MSADIDWTGVKVGFSTLALPNYMGCSRRLALPAPSSAALTISFAASLAADASAPAPALRPLGTADTLGAAASPLQQLW